MRHSKTCRQRWLPSTFEGKAVAVICSRFKAHWRIRADATGYTKPTVQGVRLSRQRDKYTDVWPAPLLSYEGGRLACFMMKQEVQHEDAMSR